MPEFLLARQQVKPVVNIHNLFHHVILNYTDIGDGLLEYLYPFKD